MSSSKTSKEFLVREIRGTNRRAFLISHLSTSSRYRRAAGFFSSGVFRVAPLEWLRFFEKGGTFELVTSPRLSLDDIRTLTDALVRPRKVQKPRTPLPTIGLADSRWAANLLGWGFARGNIAIRIAVSRTRDSGLYHEKFGVFFGDSAETGFLGSANETWSAYTDNFELIYSWGGPGGRLPSALATSFERLWTNSTTGLEVIPFVRALQSGLLEIDDHGAHPSQLPPTRRVEPMILQVFDPRIPYDLRPYQKKAVTDWVAAGGRGIFEMATGTGKTVAAMSVAKWVYDRYTDPILIVIVAPYLHLVDQWVDECGRWGPQAIRCAESSSTWAAGLESALRLLRVGRQRLTVAVATNSTFTGKTFQRMLAKVKVRTLFIADEVHNFGARKVSNLLPEGVSLRLGLSATWKRHLDDEGTKRIRDYFGPPLVKLGLAEALDLEPPVLSPYRYFPILVELTPDESHEYLEISQAITRMMTSYGATLDDLEDTPLQSLLVKRARLLANAKGKIPALREAMRPFTRSGHLLVYCGDGSYLSDTDASHQPPGGVITRQLDEVVSMLGAGLGMRVRKYVSNTSSDERSQIVDDFVAGRTQAIVAIRCLDEGVDIPGMKRAFILASSINPRQAVQRRGRLLRRAPGKTHAEVYDFVVQPPRELSAGSGGGGYSLRTIVKRELERVVEFATLAENKYAAIQVMWPLIEEHDLHSYLGALEERQRSRQSPQE